MKITVANHIKELIPYQPGKPIEELERELGITNSVKMASNENPLGPSKLALDAISKNLHNIYYYPDGGGFYLKKAIAKKLALDASNIFLGNGSNEVIEMIVKAFMNPSSEAIMAESSFAVYKLIVKAFNATSVIVPLKDFTHDLDRMADAITEKTRVIFIANPNNPTGTIVKTAEMERFLKRVPENVIVVIDEAYFEYVESPDYPKSLNYIKDYENIVIMRTFSKIYGLAGLRVGYGIGNKQIIDYMDRVRQPFNVNMLAQIGALACLDDTEHVKKSNEINREGKDYIYNELKRLNLDYVLSETNFILIKVGSGKEVQQKLLHKGVIVRPMEVYNLPEFIRVTIGMPEDNKRFIAELEKATSNESL